MKTKDRLINAKANFAHSIAQMIERRLGRVLILEDLDWTTLEGLNFLAKPGNASNRYLEQTLNYELYLD